MEKIKNLVIAVLGTIIVAGFAFYLISSRGQKQDVTSTPSTPPAEVTQTPTTTPPVAPVLGKTFEEAGAGYAMAYPADWIYETKGEGFRTVIFSGASGTVAYRATVNIQNIPSKANDGNFATAKDVMEDMKKQLLALEGGKIVDEQPLSYTADASTTLDGIQLAAEYTLQGETYQQWQIVVPRTDGMFFNTIAYTAPAGLFATYQPTAQAMIQTWTMTTSTK
ncbi:MAG: hypothetical protein V1745_04355 [Patescibacteria group bacterium]